MPEITRGGQLISAITRVTPWKLLSSTICTNNTAFGAISAKADVFITNGRQPREPLPAGLLTDASTGRYFFDKPDGSLLLLRFLGTGSDNDTGLIRLWGWEQCVADGNDGVQWTPALLHAATITLSAKTGVSGGFKPETWRYADQIAASNGSGRALGAGVRVTTPTAADDGSVIMYLDAGISPRFELELTRGSSATGLMAEYAGATGV